MLRPLTNLSAVSWPKLTKKLGSCIYSSSGMVYVIISSPEVGECSRMGAMHFRPSLCHPAQRSRVTGLSAMLFSSCILVTLKFTAGRHEQLTPMVRCFCTHRHLRYNRAAKARHGRTLDPCDALCFDKIFLGFKKTASSASNRCPSSF
jgi:hypothetical protein